MSEHLASVIAVDISCSSLAVSCPQGTTVLDPAVATASVLAIADGSHLPAGGDRVECSPRSDQLARLHPEERLTDPYAWIHRDRVDVSGLSVPIRELVAAPLHRALRVAGATSHDQVLVVVPTIWGPHRVERIISAAHTAGCRPRVMPCALVTAEALPSSTARWTTVVESDATSTTVSMIERAGGAVSIKNRALVIRWDPCRDTANDDELDRVVHTIAQLRRTTTGAGVGSAEILVRGRLSPALTDRCDQLRQLSFAVSPVAAVDALVRMLSTG